jgi:superfamily II DNA or RNA helicase
LRFGTNIIGGDCSERRLTLIAIYGIVRRMVELNQSLLVDLGGWPAMKEARALVERGKVLEVTREDAVIRARVQGAEKVHEPKITLADRVANVTVSCTCPDSRRSGRVCAHALAAGLALLRGSPRPPGAELVGSANTKLDRERSASPAPGGRGLPRFALDDAPPGTPHLELTVLLPLQLADALAKDPVRVILEARRDSDAQPLPLDAMLPTLRTGFAVSEEDERLLAALERVTGLIAGVNAIPRAKIGTLLRALDAHPRVWIGKKQRIEVRSSSERPQLVLRTREDNSLEVGTRVPSRPTSSADGKGLRSLPWTLEGTKLIESTTLPASFPLSGTLVVPRNEIPDFLSRRLPEFERTCDLAFAPGFEEFQLEIGKPAFEARLEGALSGLTLELIAHYGGKTFAVDGKTAPATYQRYVPDVARTNRFWRRNVIAERGALAEVERAGFTLVRGDTFSIIRERDVARFLANTLPRWRQTWAVELGSRLESVMTTVDIAEPEFSLRRGSGEDWLSLDLKLTTHGEPVPLDASEIQRWLQTGQTHVRTAQGRTLLVPTEAWGEMQEVLADCEVDQQPGAIRVARTFAPYVANALTAQGFRTGENVTAELPPPDVKAALDPALWVQLRAYQAQGVTWLAGLAQQKLNGLLADDMGLGKTLQALAFVAWLQASKRGAKLVVCPTSIVTNWLRETARFTPHLRTLDLTGTDRAQKFAKRGEHDLLVTSYAILRRDVEMYRTADFSLVILDEAQHIKNRGSQNAQAAKALRAERRLVLTGTPLENSVLDLWSIYDFLQPGYLGSAADFRERYETPLTKSPNARVMERLRQRVKPFFLRRMKGEVLTELPPKLDFPTLCELTDEQKEVYRAVLAQGRRDVFENSGKAGQGRDRLAVLTTLLRLRQVCCHLDLLPSGETKRAWKEPSAKLERTFELIDEAIDGGHRVLLFSQFVRVLHLLRDEAKRREIAFCYLDGQTVDRQAEIDRFQNDSAIPLFFISLKAGGTGLNLTGADTVIHFDPWWNPAVEEQATARAHRLGQARSVSAYKLVAAGTVEEKIQALQARKRELFEASLGGDEAFVGKMSDEDVEGLLA